MKKTVKEQLQEATETNYLRVADYNRAIALTEFLKELESSYTSFELLSANAKKLQCRHLGTGNWKDADAKTELLSFTTYATFKISNIEYYIELKDNPFFESYICVWDKVTKYRKYNQRVLAFEKLRDGSDSLGTMFKYNGIENITKLKNELVADFKDLKNDIIKGGNDNE